MSEENMDRLCRTCMNESHSYSPIYEEILHDDSILFEVINDVCQLEVTMSDELPKYVCSDCSFKLSEFKKFKIRSHEVGASLLRLKGDVLNFYVNRPSGSCSMEIPESIKVKVEPEDSYEYVSSGMGYETFEEYIGIEPDDLILDTVKAEKLDSTFPDPLEVSNMLLCATEGAVRNQEHTGIKIRISKVANGENVIEKRTSVVKFRVRGKNDDPQEGTHCVNVGKPIKQSKSTKEVRFFCDYCGKGFGKKCRLGDHVRVHTGVRPFNCSICNKSFSEKSVLVRHSRIHNNEEHCVCSECGKTFKQKCYLLAHMKIHSEGKKFVCEICGKACATKAHLKRHARDHSEDNPFVCNICGKCLKHDYLLKNHLILHKDTMPFSCEICGKGFALHCRLRKHQLHHSDERPYPCNICNKSFKTKYDRNRHVGLHGVTRPYKCSFCSKIFSCNQNLEEHLKSHLGNEQFQCADFGECFVQLTQAEEDLRNDCKGK